MSEVIEHSTETIETPAPTPPNPETPETPPVAPPPEAPPAKSAEDLLRERVEGMSKSLEKVAQIVASLDRAKKTQDGELTAAQEAKRQEAVAKSAEIRQKIQEYLAVNGQDDSVATMLAQNQKVLEDQLAEQREELKLLKQAPANSAPQRSEESAWADMKTRYPHVDLRVLKNEWDKALKDADNSYTVKLAKAQLDAASFEQFKEAFANDLYHPRAAAINTAKTPPTASAPPPEPAGGKRSVPMHAGAQSAPVESDPYIEYVRRMSAEMDKNEGSRLI